MSSLTPIPLILCKGIHVEVVRASVAQLGAMVTLSLEDFLAACTQACLDFPLFSPLVVLMLSLLGGQCPCGGLPRPRFVCDPQIHCLLLMWSSLTALGQSGFGIELRPSFNPLLLSHRLIVLANYRFRECHAVCSLRPSLFSYAASEVI
jgi:hypothetical protein